MALVELPVLFRRGSVRRPGIAETLGSAKRNLPTPNMRPPDHVAKHYPASCPLAPEPCRSIPGNRSLKLACGTRDAWCGSSRSGTSTNDAQAAGRPMALNIFRVSASHREKNLPVAPARSPPDAPERVFLAQRRDTSTASTRRRQTTSDSTGTPPHGP